MRTVYQRFANTDMDEGRGRPVPIPGLFTSRAAAEQAAVGRGVYGAPAEVEEVPLFDTAEEAKQWERDHDPEYREYLRLQKKFKPTQS